MPMLGAERFYACVVGAVRVTRASLSFVALADMALFVGYA